MRVIKRYANRKLYDTQESRYITLDEISELIRSGDDLRVVDNESKEDLTSVTLAQIIFEAEKSKKSFISLAGLKRIIESGGESLQESLHDVLGQIHDSAERVGRVFRRDEGISIKDPHQIPSSATKKPRKKKRAKKNKEARPDDKLALNPNLSTRTIRDFVEGIQHTVDDWQKRVDANVHQAIESVSPIAPLQKEILTLRTRLRELEEQISANQNSPAPDPASADSPNPALDEGD